MTLLRYILVSTFLLLVGCDFAHDSEEGQGTDTTDDNVLGRWESVVGEEDEVYLELSPSTFIAHTIRRGAPGDECFEKEVGEVLARDGDEWVIREVPADGTESSGSPVTFTFRREGDNLVVVTSDRRTVFSPSTRTDFKPLCD